MGLLTSDQRTEARNAVVTALVDAQTTHVWNLTQLQTDINNADSWFENTVEDPTKYPASLSVVGAAQTLQDQRLLYWMVAKKRFDEGVTEPTALNGAEVKAVRNDIAKRFSRDRDTHGWALDALGTDCENADSYIRQISENTSHLDSFYVNASAVAQGATAAQRQMLIWQTMKKRWEESA